MKAMHKLKMALAAAIAATCAWAFADVAFDKDAILAADADYSGEVVTVAANATLNLAGNKLAAEAIAGSGAIVSAAFDEGIYATTGDTLLSGVTTPSASNYGYVDTGYKPSATDRIETRFTFNSVKSGTWWLIGANDGSSGRFDLYPSQSKLTLELNSASNGAKITMDALAAGSSYEIVIDGGKGFASVAKDGAAATTYYWEQVSFTPSRDFSLLNQKNSSSNRGAQDVTIHYFRVFDAAGNLKVNMLPVKRQDGTLCFYDTVRKSYHTYDWPSNQTEPTLTEGADISFHALDYAKTPTAFSEDAVKTSYTPSWSDRVRMKMKFGACSSTQWALSCQTGAASGRFDFYRSSDAILCIGAEHKLAPYANGDEYEFDADGNAGTAKVLLNGESLTNITWSAKSFTPNQPYILFNQTPTHTRAMPDCTVYYLNVVDTNGYERLNLVPAKKKDGTVGFYDTVRNEFLVPASIALKGGVELPRDLTAPGGTCVYKASNGRIMTSGEVGNLFNNNWTYSTDARVYFNGTVALPVTFDYDFGEGNEKVVNAYKLYAGDKTQFSGIWTCYGSNDSSAWNSATNDGWTQLDATDGEVAAPSANAQCYLRTFANTTAYRYYRLKVATGRASGYTSLTQLEYYNIPATARPGELHLASDAATANATVRLGGDLKLVKEGAGTLTASKAGQGYTGGTTVKAGTLVADATGALGLGGASVANGATLRIASPLTIAGAFDAAEGANLEFEFASRDAAPVLTLAGGASVPSSLDVGIIRDGDFAISPRGTALTSGFDFSGVTPVFTQSGWLRRITTDATGNFVAFGPSGLIISFH